MARTKNGRKRSRKTKDKGYALIMTHLDDNGSNSNFMEYCLERKELKLVMALAIFGENLQHRKGVPPPEHEDENLQFDIVTRTHVDREDPNTEAWTEGRALAHFGMA